MNIADIVKILLPATSAFIIGIVCAPFLTRYLYSKQMWKKKAGKKTFDGSATPVFDSLHTHKEVGTPKLGGLLVWVSVFVTGFIFWCIAHFFRIGTVSSFDLSKIDFVSRSQTWLPFFSLIIGGCVGAIDDLLEIKGSKDYVAGGLSLKKRLTVVGTIGLFCGSWFYFKLGVTTLFSSLAIGWLIIPLFAIVMIAMYSGGVIDGIDGLAGGVFSSIFAAYSVIAYFQHQIDLAAFCAVVVGGLLAFLWFNIPPARFYMAETGSMALTVTLTVVAFMTDSLGDGHGLLVLPVIAFLLVATTATNIIQTFSKRMYGKKVFLIAPIHHHFEAIGWPGYKVTMRYWIISIIVAGLGIIAALF